MRNLNGRVVDKKWPGLHHWEPRAAYRITVWDRNRSKISSIRVLLGTSIRSKNPLLRRPTELRKDTDHSGASNGLSQSPLTARGQSCDITTVDFAHLRNVGR